MIVKKFKVSPSVMDPEGLYQSAIVILNEDTTNENLPELPYEMHFVMYTEDTLVRR